MREPVVAGRRRPRRRASPPRPPGSGRPARAARASSAARVASVCCQASAAASARAPTGSASVRPPSGSLTRPGPAPPGALGHGQHADAAGAAPRARVADEHVVRRGHRRPGPATPSRPPAAARPAARVRCCTAASGWRVPTSPLALCTAAARRARPARGRSRARRGRPGPGRPPAPPRTATGRPSWRRGGGRGSGPRSARPPTRRAGRRAGVRRAAARRTRRAGPLVRTGGRTARPAARRALRRRPRGPGPAAPAPAGPRRGAGRGSAQPASSAASSVSRAAGCRGVPDGVEQGPGGRVVAGVGAPRLDGSPTLTDRCRHGAGVGFAPLATYGPELEGAHRCVGTMTLIAPSKRRGLTLGRAAPRRAPRVLAAAPRAACKRGYLPPASPRTASTSSACGTAPGSPPWRSVRWCGA